MMWANQVTHVMRKDVRQLGAFVAAYVALILIALGYILSDNPTFVWSLVWLLLASMLVGLLVQSDSPYRPDAFWRTRPLDPSAIWFAKIAFLALLIIALPLLAEIASMRSHQVPAGETAAMLPALAYFSFSILLSVLLLGAITPNIATFLLVLFGLVIAQNLLVPMLVMATGRSPDSLGPGWWPFVALAIWLFVSWLQYRTGRRHIRVLVGVYALGWVIAMLVPAKPGVRQDGAEVPAGLRAPVESWRSISAGSGDQDVVTLTVRLSGGSEAHAYVLRAQSEIKSYFGNASILQGMSSVTMLSTPRPPKLDSTTWVPMRIQRSGMSYQLKPSNRQLKLLTQGVPLRVSGVVEVFEPYIAGRVTLQEGAVLVTPGEKLRIAAIEPDQENFATLRYSRFTRAEDFRDNSFGSPPMFALRNLTTKEAFPFYNAFGSSGPGSILPSAYASAGTISLAFRPIAFDTVPRWRVDPPSNFELVRIGWRSVGTYPVNLDVATSPPLGGQ